MLADHLPRIALATLPTPLDALPRVSEALGGPQVLLKRDDRSGLAFGGNKPRIFEYVFGDLLSRGCDVVVTPAGVQSNHLREVTAAANRVGLRSIIVICGPMPEGEAPQGNLLLFDLLGAEVRHYPDKDLHSEEVFSYLDGVMDELRAQGSTPYLVHFDRYPGALGVAAHAAAAEELGEQFATQGVTPEYLYVPAGSGVTAAGYALGLKHLGLPTRVVVVSVIQDAGRLQRDLLWHARRGAEALGIRTRLEATDVEVTDAYLGGGHGVVTPEVSEAVRMVASHEGVLLDPTYNGKAMAALLDRVRSGRHAGDTALGLVHTGGVPALFAQNRALLQE